MVTTEVRIGVITFQDTMREIVEKHPSVPATLDQQTLTQARGVLTATEGDIATLGVMSREIAESTVGAVEMLSEVMAQGIEQGTHSMDLGELKREVYNAGASE